MMTPSALNQRAPDHAPLDIPLPKQLITTSQSIRLSGPYMSREEDTC